MNRYQAVRRMGCDPLTAALVAFMNWLMGVPKGLVRIMHIEVEYPHDEA